MKKKANFGTRVIHARQRPDPSTGAVIPPICTSSTYVQQSPGKHQGFEYSRSQNPTRFAYEHCIADLENGKQAFAFASGLTAIATILELLPSGAHIIAMHDLYGGTFRLFNNVRTASAGLSFDFIDLTDVKYLHATLTPKTKMIWLESPTNPLLKIVDLQAIAQIAKKYGILTVCDNTFATPYLQKPLDLGCDIVMHSASKYLNGHSDMIGGIAVVGDNAKLCERLQFLQNAIGAIAAPFDSYLALRGIKTLALRMQRHNENAMALATWLTQQPAIKKVYYPGLASHPQHTLATQQMCGGYGGIVTIMLHGTIAQARTFLENVQLFALAESLGGVESLIELPAMMTHASIPKKQRIKLGISDTLIRISLGIEDIDDLRADMANALTVAYAN